MRLIIRHDRVIRMSIQNSLSSPRSSGFGLFEVLELCEAAEVGHPRGGLCGSVGLCSSRGQVHCVITLNNQETPEDVADFIECHHRCMRFGTSNCPFCCVCTSQLKKDKNHLPLLFSVWANAKQLHWMS